MLVKNVEKKDSKTASFQVEVDAKEFDEAVNKAFNKNKGSISIPGFRQGKAPRAVVEGMYGHDVFYQDAIDELVAPAYEHGYDNCGLKIIGKPAVSNVDLSDDKVLTLTFDVELYPEVTLGEYKGIEVPKETVSISKAEVDAELGRMQDRNARIETVDREAKTGDTVILDFEGFVDGKPFDGGKAEGYTLTLGSGAFIPGFEDQLVGLKAGDEKDVVVTFPENYTKELAGKEATFKCKIHEVKETIKPELDDEFAKDVSEYDTLAALKKSIKADLAKKRQEAVDRDFENEAVVLAGKNMTCDIPACMIDEQVDHQIEQFAYQLQSQGMKMEDYVKMIGGDVKGMRDSMRPMAEQTVRSNILLSEIVHQENLDVTEEEVEEELKKMAEQYKMELDKIKEMVDVEAVKSDLKGRKAVKLIVDNAKPVEKEKEKKAAKKSAKKEDEAAEAPAEEAPKAEE